MFYSRVSRVTSIFFSDQQPEDGQFILLSVKPAVRLGLVTLRVGLITITPDTRPPSIRYPLSKVLPFSGLHVSKRYDATFI